MRAGLATIFAAAWLGACAGAPRSTAPPADPPPLLLTRAQILETIRSSAAAQRACYEQALEADPALGGKIQISFTISASGAVSAAEVVSSSLDHAGLQACVLAAVRSLRFPASAEPCSVVFPFLFEPVRAKAPPAEVSHGAWTDRDRGFTIRLPGPTWAVADGGVLARKDRSRILGVQVHPPGTASRMDEARCAAWAAGFLARVRKSEMVEIGRRLITTAGGIATCELVLDGKDEHGKRPLQMLVRAFYARDKLYELGAMCECPGERIDADAEIRAALESFRLLGATE
ncbi:MAG: TonB family protein [Deltaproteobacteria bacterium]|nr:TonB family protein [Deltaproteobacteria bacterium]